MRSERYGPSARLSRRIRENASVNYRKFKADDHQREICCCRPQENPNEISSMIEPTFGQYDNFSTGRRLDLWNLATEFPQELC